MFCPEGGKGTVKLLVGNKADLDGDRSVSTAEGAEFARSKGMLFLEASAKTEKAVAQCFNEVVQKVRQAPCVCAWDDLAPEADVWSDVEPASVRLSQILENPTLLASTIPAAKPGVAVSGGASSSSPASGGCC
jgi:GTPase SAR1 family protein